MSRYIKEGDKIGRLTILKSERKPLRSGGKNTTELGWHCVCICGTRKWVRHGAFIKNNPTKSCGCLQTEQLRERSLIHGGGRHPLLPIWQAMKARCLNSKHRTYYRYGGRGIKICKRWMTYANFYRDNLPHYRPHLSLDRIDNNGNYTPENTRWVTLKEQARNTSRNVFLTFEGKTQTLIAWSEELGINYQTLCKRNKTGKPVEQVLFVGYLSK